MIMKTTKEDKIYLIMKYQEQQAFENVQKELELQVVNIPSNVSPRKERSQSKIDTNQKVAWKFRCLTNTSPPKISSTFKPTTNICFADEKNQTQSINDESDEEQIKQSCFCIHYKDSTEIYHKKYDFGTNWIGKRQYFSSIFVNPSRIEKLNLQYYVPQSPFQQNIQTQKCQFDSQFESGNLHSCFRVSTYQYDLLLQNDLNTKGNTQWFYFRICNPPKGKQITINIVNLRKRDSLFNYGLMPCLYSFEENKKFNRGWFRGGRNIEYFKNNHKIQNSRRNYYTLTFSITSQHEKDTLLVAHSYPYSVSDLNNYLDSLQIVKYKQELFQRQTLFNTIGRNKIQLISISENNPKIKMKPLIFVIARQHPGQTPGSYVCQGLIDFLLSKDKESQYLRKNYEIKIIPMVNPDGVAAGNYRTNLYGYDLNRRWDGGNRSKNQHQATIIKKYFNQLGRKRQVAFVLDLHGHSRKLFSFFYGNPSSNPIQSRIYPLICSKLNPSHVRFQDSTFLSQDFKRNTARVQLGLSFKTQNIFTFQVSFYGYLTKDKITKHFTPQDLRQLGQTLMRSVYLFEKGKASMDQKQNIIFKKCYMELKNNSSLLSFGQQANSGSESSPEECEVKQTQDKKLEQDQGYECIKQAPKVKIMRKTVRKQLLPKQPSKTTRQMQVLDIAQVYSAFPSNVIALIPNSYLQKIKQPTYKTISSQTQDFPLLKIYQTCKQQELIQYNPERLIQNQEKETPFSQRRTTSNLLRSSILTRPPSSNQESSDYQPLSVKTQRRNKESSRKQTPKKAVSSRKKRRQDKGIQTMLTLGRWFSNHLANNYSLTHHHHHPSDLSHHSKSVYTPSTMSNFKTRLTQQTDLLEYKSVDPTFSTLQQKGRTTNNKILSKNIVQNIRSRRKN